MSLRGGRNYQRPTEVLEVSVLISGDSGDSGDSGQRCRVVTVVTVVAGGYGGDGGIDYRPT